MARPKNCENCELPKRPKSLKKPKGDVKDEYCYCKDNYAITDSVLQKLEDAFSFGLSDEKACFLAGISPRSLYYYQDQFPEFLQRKNNLKNSPDITAIKTVVANLDNPNMARWWVERTNAKFMPKSKMETTLQVSVGESQFVEMSDEEKEALEAFQKARRKRIEGNSKSLPD